MWKVICGAVALGVSSPADVASALKIAQANSDLTAKDKFAATEGVPLKAGDAVSVDIALHDGDASGKEAALSGFYTYDNGMFTAHFSPDTQTSDDVNLSYRSVAYFRSVTTKGGTYIAENAFGARRQVSNWTVRRNGVATAGKAKFDSGIKVSVPANGQEAKRLSQSVRIRISGKVAPLESGKLVECKHTFQAATIHYLERIVWKECWAGVNVESVEFLDTVTGKVLR